MGVIVGVVGGVVVLAAVAFFALRGGGTTSTSGDGKSMSAEQAIKEADAALAQHDYLKAVELYESAAAKGTTSKSLKKAKEEAPAQQAYNDLNKSIASSDWDKAKAQMDTLLADPDRHWAKQGAGKADDVKRGYVKQHLGNAQAAKSDPDACAREAGMALQADPSNEEAQKVAQSCKGGAAKPVAVTEKRDPPKRAPQEPKEPKEPPGPSAAERTANATKLIGEGNALYQSRDFDGAIDKFQQAVAQKPANNVLGFAYRGLGSAYAQKGDKPNAYKYFKLYLPLAPDAGTKAQVGKLIEAYKP
jgi:tetratricopeptide (TPR) repeat protein